ncbi:hypothetical protein AB0950_39895 [Streptomyces sp. NPDC007189]|uniref:hypothetical protein n=1 Tax=Streptomyces sp. NPDC007189 TaxID=3154315 RepID=UPI003452B513
MICTICWQPIRNGEPRKRVTRSRPSGGMVPVTPAYTHKLCRQKPDRVPYIAAWSSERFAAEPPVVQGLLGGIRYEGEMPADRDGRGVLWLRRPDTPGKGRPRYVDVHPGRQRRCMADLLCQVCGGPADQDDDGRVLRLIEDARADWEGWPNDLVTTHPPICPPCVATARAQCPHTWQGSVAVRVGRSEVCGVWGRRYTASRLGPLPVESGVVPFKSPLLGWTVAAQLVRALNDCSIVSLDEAVAAHA